MSKQIPKSDSAQLSSHRQPGILMIAGFGDNASMFDALHDTELAERYRLCPFHLPGFGAPALDGETTLQSLADCVLDEMDRVRAHIIMAHSVASVVAAKAAIASNGQVSCILSLEGNLTAEDAYFSGTAADFDAPEEFRLAFLSRLRHMAKDDAILTRYLREVEKADPVALWELGCDARRYSDACVPGEDLMAAASARYFYNPGNCPQDSVAWLKSHRLPSTVLDEASHWAPLDQPELLANCVIEALRKIETA